MIICHGIIYSVKGISFHCSKINRRCLINFVCLIYIILYIIYYIIYIIYSIIYIIYDYVYLLL